ncbi:MAG: hypothetical protein K0V04_36295 [Deltaproteobacteria bacterium]|nr:hypothetical protein [Deltaproteobacteria bacterium]
MRIRPLLLATVLLVPQACGGKEDAAKGMESLRIPARKAPTIVLVDAGQEPRAMLALHPSAGSVETFTLSMGTRMSLSEGNDQMPSLPVPTTQTRLRLEVKEVNADGFVVHHAVEAVDVKAAGETPPPPEVLAKVRETVEPLTHYRSQIQLDPRGEFVSGEVQFPRDLPAPVHSAMQQMTQSLGQLSVPLPEAAVGPGARWTVVSELSQAGTQVRQTSEYTLVSRTDDTVNIEATVAQELLDPNVAVPGMPGDARVGEFSSSGKGSFVLDLRRIAPKSLTMTVDLSMTMDVAVLGQTKHLTMDLGLDLGIAPATPQ